MTSASTLMRTGIPLRVVRKDVEVLIEHACSSIPEVSARTVEGRVRIS